MGYPIATAHQDSTSVLILSEFCQMAVAFLTGAVFSVGVLIPRAIEVR
ncbi:MAG: hypothetical protein F6K28_37880 [Microcoleus sp. SIO2G3]|nr:hypothetical protein [Microcoleus sp. SIO2G3]